MSILNKSDILLGELGEPELMSDIEAYHLLDNTLFTLNLRHNKYSLKIGNMLSTTLKTNNKGTIHI